MTFFKTFQAKTASHAMTVLGDADLVRVSGGFCGFYIKGPAAPIKTTGGSGGLKLDGVDGESMSSSHGSEIDL